MKLLWLHLMPYAEPPEDCAQRNDSVRVDIDSRRFDARVAHGLGNRRHPAAPRLIRCAR